jgi:hypothetical protein
MAAKRPKIVPRVVLATAVVAGVVPACVLGGAAMAGCGDDSTVSPRLVNPVANAGFVADAGFRADGDATILSDATPDHPPLTVAQIGFDATPDHPLTVAQIGFDGSIDDAGEDADSG